MPASTPPSFSVAFGNVSVTTLVLVLLVLQVRVSDLHLFHRMCLKGYEPLVTQINPTLESNVLSLKDC